MREFTSLKEIVDHIKPLTTDKYLFEMSQRIHEVVSNVQDLTEQIDYWMKEADCIRHELAGYDPDLDEPDLHGKEEVDRAVEGGDVDGTLP
jgi:regulator of replication initiation timing